MRVSQPIILYLPNMLIDELDNYLKRNPPKFKIHKVYFYFIVHHLIIRQIQYSKEEYFSIDKKYLRSVTCNNIDRYIKILENGEFIISDKKYTRGIKSLQYKINEVFIKGVNEFTLETESKFGKRLVKDIYKKKAHYNRLEPHLRLMRAELMKMMFDYNNAYRWAENNSNGVKKLSYLTSISQIENKLYRYFKRNSTNRRLDTNLTNLKSELRQFIIGDYVSIDIKNSQPFLLGILIDNIINNRDTLCSYLSQEHYTKTFGIKGIKRVLLIHQNQEKTDMVKFRIFYDSVLNGTLYDDLVSRYTGQTTRNAVKDIMFKVLFSKNVCYSKYNKFIPYEDEKKVFTSVYSFVGEVVKALKVKDHSTLPIYLQRFESFLFIDCIAKGLVNNGIIPFTIHDSVIVKSKDKKKTIDIMDEIFMKQIGVIPSYKIKNIND
jgi:hypothetical protein